MQFGRLKDTRFPNLDNVDVYAYRNEFDYTRWIAGTTIKMCNVLWNSDYSDVVKFDTNILRDKWFDDLQDYYTITLDSDRSYVPEQEVKIPIPYDVAARYNYMVLTIPVLPGSNPSINYEDSEAGIRKWFFFVDSIDYRAPNSTGCRISLDVWTQYQNDVDIKYMMLQRGHAPVAYSDVDEYLANPIANNKYLLAPDITPTNAEVVRSTNFIPFGNGTKYVCFASTCPASELTQMGTVTHNDPDYTFGNLSYSNVDARYGYQLQVNGFKVGDGDNYSSLRTQSNPMARSQDVIPNGSYMYAIPAASAEAFVKKVQEDCPVFFRTVLACFMVDADMITLGTSISFHGYTLRECEGKNSDVEISLTKAMFAFPAEYQHLAKLYTFPYSAIELTDNNGETVSIRVENTGNIVAHKNAMLAFPYLNARIWFDGINGRGSQSYTWIDMNGTSQQLEMPNSDWSLACFDLDIPCYAIYMDADTAWKMDNFWTAIRGGAKRALAAYHSAVRSANTARENAHDSNNTMYDNADRDATLHTTNTSNNADNLRNNADLTIATNTANKDAANTAADHLDLYSQSALDRTTATNNAVSNATARVEAEVATSTTDNTAEADLFSGTLSGAMAGVGTGAAIGAAGGPIGAGGGAAIGAIVGASGAWLHGALAKSNNTILINGNVTSVSLATQANTAKATISKGHATIVKDEQNQLNTDTNTNNNNCLNKQTNNTKTTMNTNATNTAAAMRANADATRDTGNDNATYTRQVGVLNAKENLEASHDGVQYDLYHARMSAPVQLTPDKGNAYAYLGMYNGVQFKVRTMPDGDIRQIGDTFLRYGYALNQMWDVAESGLCPMSHFCYWKAEDIWVDDRQSSNNAVQGLIINMFLRGVTVWKNPDEIGRIDIHVNK